MKISHVLALIIGKLLGTALFIFPMAYVLMLAWNAIAWHANLPQFTYWNVFWITCAIDGIFGLLRKSHKN